MALRMLLGSQPVYVAIDIEDKSVELKVQSVSGLSTIGPLEATWFLGEFTQLRGLLETRSCREVELRTVVRDLSKALIAPIEQAIDSCSEMVVALPRGPLGIPLDLLSYRGSPLFLNRSVSYRIGKTADEQCVFQWPWSGFILSDSSADPERACLAVARRVGRVTYQDEHEVTLDSLHLQSKKDIVVFSIHGRVGGEEPDHMRISSGIVLPQDLTGLRPRLVYLDSCRLGVSRQFLNCFRDMGTEYYVAPILSNEAGVSSTQTMMMFFEYLLDGKTPEMALFLTRQKLWGLHCECDLPTRWWRAFAFRVYRLN